MAKNSKYKLEKICEKWMPIAKEYVKFLNRYKLDTVSIVTKKTDMGYVMAIFADGEEYLKLSLENEQFVAEEKQLDELLKVIEKLFVELCYTNEADEDCYEDTYCESEYEDDEL